MDGKRFISAVGTILIGFPVNAAHSAPMPINEEMSQAFSWFDRLGFPDIRKLQPVRVTTSSKEAGRPPTERSELAFLVHDSGATFTILTIRLHEETLVKSQLIGNSRFDARHEPC